MNDITPKEANEILSHYTDLGYGIVIEGDDTSKIKQALSLASKTLENGTPITEGDLIMFRTLMTEIANKGLTFEEVLLLIDNAKTPTEGDLISREALIREIGRTDEWYKGRSICDIIDNAPTVPLPNEQIAWKQGYECGYHQAKEDVARRIKEQYNEHHELIPYWLSIGDTKGGAE